jgi:lipopolysaccharide/colanic/teichoic acid biosynthesis glycosyltransferase
MGNAKADLNTLCRLPDFLIQSVRSTDEVGWFDTNQIGVLLLDTSPAGAYQFLEKIKRNAPSSLSLPNSLVYVYPSDMLAGGKSNSDGLAAMDVGEKLDSFKNATTRGGGKASKVQPVRSTSCPVENLEIDSVCPIEGLEPYLGIRAPLWKRVFDIAASLSGLFVLLPFMSLVAILIKSVSPGPVFFKQRRIGYLGRPFVLMKFRTMRTDARSSTHEAYVRELIHHDVPMKKLDRQQEIIPFGKFLRSSGIDELPQLINVLCGEMSLVGPRPCLPLEFQEYLHWHKRRFYTLPGITGLWQVNGKHSLTFKEMIRYDILYEQQRSFWLDFKIITRTFPTVYRLATDG